MIIDYICPRGRGHKMCLCTRHSCEQLTHQIWLDFVQWFRGDSMTDGRTEAIAISLTLFLKKKKRWDSNRESHQGSKYFARRPDPGGEVKIQLFSEHGNIAYQIKRNHECNIMVAHILPADPLYRPWSGIKRSTFIFFRTRSCCISN